jgi:4-amino-4-deoxy-L-arabinose transferase-like glycosyltransferase
VEQPVPDLAASKAVRLLIGLTLIANALGMLCPVLISGDANAYASVARHIAQHDDWINLFLNGTDWLDKPHFPFWVTALFFKLLGIRAFSYVLPGFLFHLLGGYYTYRIARLFYDRGVALLALLVYFTALHLMMSTIDVRAEVYLTGLIMPACYYWLRFDESPKAKYLLAGAVCTACAVMTKGLFVLATIGSGLVCSWASKKEWRKFLNPKWLLALALTFFFILPELVALYLQFDLHPEKVVFRRQSVSGLRFFFWDSQFGRFFNSGPIKNTSGNHLFYVVTFLWTFLPWSAAFLCAAYDTIRRSRRLEAADRAKSFFLYGSFAIPLIIFSATRYQYDYYLDILLPFAAIISAKYLHDALRDPSSASWVPAFQGIVSVALMVGLLGLSLLAVRKNLLLVFTALFCAGAILHAFRTRHPDPLFGAFVYPVLAMNLIFLFVGTVTAQAIVTHDASYHIASYLRHQPPLPVFLLHDNRARLIERIEMQSDLSFRKLDTMEQAKAIKGDFYLIANDDKLPAIMAGFPQAKLLYAMDTLEIQYFGRAYRSQTRWPVPLTGMAILRIGKDNVQSHAGTK